MRTGNSLTSLRWACGWPATRRLRHRPLCAKKLRRNRDTLRVLKEKARESCANRRIQFRFPVSPRESQNLQFLYQIREKRHYFSISIPENFQNLKVRKLLSRCGKVSPGGSQPRGPGQKLSRHRAWDGRARCCWSAVGRNLPCFCVPRKGSRMCILCGTIRLVTLAYRDFVPVERVNGRVFCVFSVVFCTP